MALTVTDDTSVMFDGECTCENCGTWTALGAGVSSIGPNCDVKRVGCASMGSKNDAGNMCPFHLRGGLQITRIPVIDFCDCCVRRGIVTFWFNTTQTLTELDGCCVGGLSMRLGSDACNYSCWNLATCDGVPACCLPAYPGGWVKYTLDLEKTPTSTTGCPVWACTDYFAYQIDAEIDISGNICTTFIDQVRFLTAAEVVSCCPAMATITGTVTVAGALFCEIFASTQSMCTSGIVTKAGGALNLNYSLDLGGAAATGTFTSTCELITVGPNAQMIPGGLFIRFLGDASNTHLHRFGSEVGCGSASVGFGGGLMKAINGNTYDLIATCNDLDQVEVFGMTIDGADLIDWTDTVDKMVSSTITNTRKIDFGCGAEMRDGVITCGSETCVAIGQIEFLVGGPTCPEFRDMLIQNQASAMEWSINGADCLDLRNISYANNTNDLRFNHSCGQLCVNVLECGASPSTSDGGAGGTVVVNNNVCINVTVLDTTGCAVGCAKVGIFTTPVCPGDSALFCGLTNACGVFMCSHSLGCDVPVSTRVRLLGFKPSTTLGTINMCGLCVPVTFIACNIVDVV